MRRIVALIVLCAGLLAAGAPSFACATAAAAGDCCPADAAGCTQVFEQLSVEASICCVTAAVPAQIVAAESGRELHVVQLDHGSVDPGVPPASSALPPVLARAARQAVPLLPATWVDASLTYLHTGRLRL
jgi:hypothetical protein